MNKRIYSYTFYDSKAGIDLSHWENKSLGDLLSELDQDINPIEEKKPEPRFRIHANELPSVTPMEPPKGMLFYLDYKYEDKK